MKTVVLVGDVGAGKSSITEKLTGHKGLSSNAAVSFTRETKCFPAPDGSFRVLDTPGVNAADDVFQHNVWVAQALSYKPVSMIALVVQAHVRLDNIIAKLHDRLASLVEFSDVLTVVVTFMDGEREWTPEECAQKVKDTFDLHCIFVQPDTPRATLHSEFLSQCDSHPELNINVDHENFFQFFKLPGNNLKILKTAKAEVSEFSKIIQQFKDNVDRWPSDRGDLVCEFHAWCMQYITQAQQNLSEAHGFTFEWDKTVEQATFLANMTNQMKEQLLSIRLMLLGSHSNAQVTQNRRCPFCGLVWMKTEGCDGATVCGALPSGRDSRVDTFATFTFKYSRGSLEITKSGQRSARGRTENQKTFGCGRTITWSDMAPVDVPQDVFKQHSPSVIDVPVLPAAKRRRWQEVFEKEQKEVVVVQPAVPSH